MGRNPAININMQTARHITTRNILFLFFNIGTIIIFYVFPHNKDKGDVGSYGA